MTALTPEEQVDVRTVERDAGIYEKQLLAIIRRLDALAGERLAQLLYTREERDSNYRLLVVANSETEVLERHRAVRPLACPRLLLVGESNPLSDRPALALYPVPSGSAGGRLARILCVSNARYLLTFDRVNLCGRKWSGVEASRSVAALARNLARSSLDRVLLGSRVARVHGVPFRPFEAGLKHSDGCRRYRDAVARGGGQLGECLVGAGCFRYLVLPHPSGRCRAWNDPGAASRARASLEAFAPGALVAPLAHPHVCAGSWGHDGRCACACGFDLGPKADRGRNLVSGGGYLSCGPVGI